MRIILLLMILISCLQSAAQENASQTAKNFIRKGDYSNAVLVLNRAIERDASNIELKKDLAFAYYLQRDFSHALSTITSVTESKAADAHSFQILGMIYEALNERREAERTYKVALRKFQGNGMLHNEYGELLWSNASFSDAISQWEKGIKKDPAYPGNYYNASRYYYLSADKVWGLIYGEIFINLESYSKRTPEVKAMLLNGYKKLFSETDLFEDQDKKNAFAKAFLETMKSHAKVVEKGVTPDALAALRTRFLLTWLDQHASKFPFKLFDYHKQLARSGMFDAYNQWIFGSADNLIAFQQWTVIHSDEYKKFVDLQKNRVFKVPEGQSYR